MSGPFKVGDVVVCVVAGPLACPNLFSAEHLGINLPLLHQPMKVTGTAPEYDMESGVILCGCTVLILADGSQGIASRFRHLPKADPSFTEAMRALRPEKEGVA